MNSEARLRILENYIQEFQPFYIVFAIHWSEIFSDYFDIDKKKFDTLRRKNPRAPELEEQIVMVTILKPDLVYWHDKQRFATRLTTSHVIDPLVKFNGAGDAIFWPELYLGSGEDYIQIGILKKPLVAEEDEIINEIIAKIPIDIFYKFYGFTGRYKKFFSYDFEERKRQDAESKKAIKALKDELKNLGWSSRFDEVEGKIDRKLECKYIDVSFDYI